MGFGFCCLLQESWLRSLHVNRPLSSRCHVAGVRSDCFSYLPGSVIYRSSRRSGRAACGSAVIAERRRQLNRPLQHVIIVVIIVRLRLCNSAFCGVNLGGVIQNRYTVAPVREILNIVIRRDCSIYGKKGVTETKAVIRTKRILSK